MEKPGQTEETPGSISKRVLGPKLWGATLDNFIGKRN